MVEIAKTANRKTQHRDLWHFEQVIDETIENLKPLAKPHGRLIDADDLDSITVISYPSKGDPFVAGRLKKIIAPTIIEAENESEAQKWARVGRDISKGFQEGIVSINSEVPE